MALISLAPPAAGRLRAVLLAIGLGGASLFFGDAMITPAISVLRRLKGCRSRHRYSGLCDARGRCGSCRTFCESRAGAAVASADCSGR
jgi:K+ potassium transporter